MIPISLCPLCLGLSVLVEACRGGMTVNGGLLSMPLMKVQDVL